MSKIISWLDRTLYPGFTSNWDDVLFREKLLNIINDESVCLDYGAGRGNVKEMNFKNKAKFIAGVDPEESVVNNPFLDEGKVLDLSNNKIPYEDNKFDVVFSDNVIEHIADPAVVFNEINRVLKPGGILITKTPNKYHYMPIVARLTPIAFHKFYNKLRGRESHDTFPTLYMCNTPGDVHKYAEKTGFSVKNIDLWEGRPEYLRIFFPLYIIGYIYERIVNLSNIFSMFRSVLVSELEKK